MAPVPPALQVQISNRRESDGMGNKERQKENKREEEPLLLDSTLSWVFFFSQSLRKSTIIFPVPNPSTVCFWKAMYFFWFKQV